MNQRSEAIAVDGVSLWVEQRGQGEPLLLLHGLGSSGVDYAQVAPALEAGHRVIVPDVRGHGRSDKPPGAYSIALFARDLEHLCDALGVQRVHVAGLSMGGMIAFQMAVDRPELVRSLTIINSGPALVPKTLAQKWPIWVRLFVLRWFGPRAWGKVLAPKLFPKPEQHALRQEVIERMASNDPSAYLRATKALIGWSVLDRVPDIACPVLVLASDRDYSPRAAKEAYAVLLRDARIVDVRDSGHAAPADQPGQVTAALSSFLTEVEEAERRRSAGARPTAS